MTDPFERRVYALSTFALWVAAICLLLATLAGDWHGCGRLLVMATLSYFLRKWALHHHSWES